MSQTVEIPDHGIAEFPDDMTPDQIKGVIQQKFFNKDQSVPERPSAVAQEATTALPKPSQTVENAIQAAAETASGFIPKSPLEVASMATPLVSGIQDIIQTPKKLSDVLFGGKTVAQAFPESQTLAEAETTPPFSKERFKAGFDVLAQLGTAAVLGRQIAPRTPTLSETLGTAAPESPQVAAVNEGLSNIEKSLTPEQMGQTLGKNWRSFQPQTPEEVGAALGKNWTTIKPEGVPPNASQIESTTTPDGGVRARSEMGVLPQGNVEAADARLRSDTGEGVAAPRQGTEAGTPTQETPVAGKPFRPIELRSPTEPVGTNFQGEPIYAPEGHGVIWKEPSGMYRLSYGDEFAVRQHQDFDTLQEAQDSAKSIGLTAPDKGWFQKMAEGGGFPEPAQPQTPAVTEAATGEPQPKVGVETPAAASETLPTGTGEAPPTERISWGTPLEVDRSGRVSDVRQQLQKGDYAIGVRYIPEAQVNRYFTGKVVKVGKNWVDVEYKGKVERINEKLSKLTENDGRIIEQSQKPTTESPATAAPVSEPAPPVSEAQPTTTEKPSLENLLSQVEAMPTSRWAGYDFTEAEKSAILAREAQEAQPVPATTEPATAPPLTQNEPFPSLLQSAEDQRYGRTPKPPVPPESRTAVPLETPPVQEAPPTGISNARLQEVYGDSAPVATTGKGPGAWKNEGISRLDNFQKTGDVRNDPYSVLTNLREGRVPMSQVASDVSLLRAEHQRLVEAARQAEGTPQYEARSQAALDMAKAIKGVAHGPASDVFRSLQEYDQPRYDNITDFDQALRERLGRESTPQEKASFRRIVDDVKRTGNGAEKEIVEAQSRVQKYLGKRSKLSFDDAAKSVQDQITQLVKDCIV